MNGQITHDLAAVFNEMLDRLKGIVIDDRKKIDMIVTEIKNIEGEIEKIPAAKLKNKTALLKKLETLAGEVREITGKFVLKAKDNHEDQEKNI